MVVMVVSRAILVGVAEPCSNNEGKTEASHAPTSLRTMRATCARQDTGRVSVSLYTLRSGWTDFRTLGALRLTTSTALRCMWFHGLSVRYLCLPHEEVRSTHEFPT